MATRSNMYMIDPEHLVLITDKEDPLYDPRVNLPIEENMVLNIMYHGVIQNIVAIRRADTYVVVTGRQRVKAAREANKRLRAEGNEPVRIPVVLGHGDEGVQVGVMVSENELRQSDSILEKCEKCRKFLAMGRTEQEASIVFGVTVQTIKNWMEIVGLSPSVKKAVDSEAISATAAAKLSGLAPAEQKAAVEELLAEKPNKKMVSIKRAAARAGKKTGMRSRKEILAVVESAEDAWIRGVLLWVLGEQEIVGPTTNTL